MEPNTEVERLFRNDEEDDEEEKKKCMRPPSSYGSMKSDSDEMEEEERVDEEVSEVFATPFPVELPDPEPKTHDETGVQMYRSESPETLYTMTTQQTKPPGAMVIDTRSSDLGDFSEEDEEDDADELLIADSPEPPEPVEPEDTMHNDENSQPGRLHPEQDLPYLFRTIQSALTALEREVLFKFKSWYYQLDRGITLQQIMNGDLLDFVDKTIEIFGQEQALINAIRTLESMKKKPEAEQLQAQCNRALIRYHLKEHLIRKYQAINEGVIQAGKQRTLNNIYVEPLVSTCVCGGVDPSHEIRPYPATPVQVPSADTFMSPNNLFRLQKADGQPVRTVVTTGIAGIGMTVAVAKFCLDWAELQANKDLQFVIKMSFRSLWNVRYRNFLPDTVSIMEVIEYFHPECKDMKYLEEEDCKFLLIMDSFDSYQAPLDWENAPVINDNYTKVNQDVLIVNIIRGTVLRGARIWILGREAAVSQIPSQFIDAVTEIQGFSDEKVDEYLTKRFREAELAAKIVAHYKRLPTLRILARQPFVSWMVATVFARFFNRYRGYGELPPRLTPFYIGVMTVQINRRLQFYYYKRENDLKWSDDDKQLLIKMGKMAFKMLERNASVFSEEDMKDYGLKVTDTTVFSGMCTELPAALDGKRKYCFVHFSYQEFMAAVYVFTIFRNESKNVLESTLLPKPKIFTSKDQTRSAAGLVQCALTRTLGSWLGHYDMFLRFLCGMISPHCHDDLLQGCLYEHDAPKVSGLDEAQRVLEQTIQTAEEKNRDRVENLKECLRELTQERE